MPKVYIRRGVVIRGLDYVPGDVENVTDREARELCAAHVGSEPQAQLEPYEPSAAEKKRLKPAADARAAKRKLLAETDPESASDEELLGLEGE